MTWISSIVTVSGLVLLAHACYSAQEHSAISSTTAQHGLPQQLATSSLPIDISIEALVATLVVVLGLVLGSPKLRPIKWHEWAGKIEREGEAGFRTGSGEVEKDYRGNPFSILETRPGFVDIRKQRPSCPDPGFQLLLARAIELEEGDQGGERLLSGVPVLLRQRELRQYGDTLGQSHEPSTDDDDLFARAFTSVIPSEQPLPSYDNTQVRGSSEPIQHEIVMAIDMKDNSTMGCAYFATTDGVLRLSEDIPMANLDVAEQFLLHVEPTTLLVSARAPEKFKKYLETTTTPKDASGGIIFRGLQSSEFSPESAQERLVSLQSESLSPTGIIFSSGMEENSLGGSSSPIAGLARPESNAFRSLRCGGYINLNSNASVGCAGAVLGDLHRRRSAGFLPDGQVAGVLFRVVDVCMFSLSFCMFLNADALLSLQIVQTELHPNSQAWGSDSSKSNSKESLSIYGLFHHLACTPQGRSHLRQLFLRPVLDLSIIQERQKTISVLLQPDNADRIPQITSTLRKIRNIRTTFTQMRKGVEFPSAKQSFDRGVWATIQQFTTHTLALREILGSLNGGTEAVIIIKLIESLIPANLVTVGDMINRTIDFEQSKTRHRSSVKPGVDTQLDELKRTYDGMNTFLTQLVNQVRPNVPEWARQYIRSCIFLPQIGFLTVVEPNPATGKGKYEGEGLASGTWDKMFMVDEGVCYKNHEMKELDGEYGDMYSKIGDREVEIIHSLVSSILEHEDLLASASDMCGEFDAILALALGAEKYNWRAPRVVEASIIDIKGGRHPLQELVVPAFVPNDCSLGSGQASTEQAEDDLPRALVLTGPNHSGKSVYLKQTAIIVYLAHIGSFVPATQATIGLTDKILTCISPRESMSGGESAFARDMKQAALSMRTSTSRSLVLVDEFGKGTKGDDGSGLLASLLDHFLSLGTGGPRLLAATHFHEIFEGEYLSHHRGLYLAHMNVRVDWDAPQIEDQVTYLFSLAYGHSTSSFGGRCAALNGVPTAVVDRAESIAQLLARNEDLGAICTRLTRAEEHQLEKAETAARLFLGHVFDETSGDERCQNGTDDQGSIKYVLGEIFLLEA
ncbi:dna mismatch repair msh5 [Fusarium albosuccineum]|uniref:DNA mismatch repair protein MSH5 n=1 Tax=Fusarium albosuccineum TaxID=1237068 RepID=A0A8H4L846_9HYPO|nr:dna mismatch repair msh5 [Fusarium albosuccineum]